VLPTMPLLALTIGSIGLFSGLLSSLLCCNPYNCSFEGFIMEPDGILP
jgi:hypothetical protein